MKTTQPTKPARDARRAKPKAEASGAAGDAPTIDVSRSVWNTLGAAKLLGLSPARVVRAVASGQLYSSRRIIGGDGKPRFAFSHTDLHAYAAWLMTNCDESDISSRSDALEAIKSLVR